MKGTNRATIHHLNKEKTTHAYYTYWKASKYFWVFKGFANFYLILVMQIFMDFQNFAIFCLVLCKVLKEVKINFYASGSLLLVGVKPSPMVVSPPLLLGLLLLSLQVVDPLIFVSLPILS